MAKVVLSYHDLESKIKAILNIFNFQYSIFNIQYLEIKASIVILCCEITSKD